MDELPVDKARDEIQRLAAACLDHVRAVQWGQGSATYGVNDGGLRLSVSIVVTCNRRADECKDEI
jgi:hypothetical protein